LDAGGRSNATNLLSGDLKASYDILPHSRVNPFLFVGAGALYFDPRRDYDAKYLGTDISKIDVVYMGGAGLDFFLSEFFSITVSGDFVMTNTNKLDMKKSGTANESYSRANVEFRYYFFDQNYITKLLKALQERYEKK
jgi:hypothetical protein